ncbi:MAG: transposase [Chloroflexi bacterium]|nr:transposase [Chloroflexota bacterium]
MVMHRSDEGSAAGPAVLSQDRPAAGATRGEESVRFYRRRLPHFEVPDSTYFVSYTTRPGIRLSEAERSVVLDNWRHWDGIRYTLWAAVVMPDHVHVLITPYAASLEQILHTNKSWTAHAINRERQRTGPLWQRERYDRITRSEADWVEKWRYIAENPVKAGLSDSPDAYPWYYGWRDDQGILMGAAGPAVGTTGHAPAHSTGQRPALPPSASGQHASHAGSTAGPALPGSASGQYSPHSGSAAGPAVPGTGQRPALPSEPAPKGAGR